MTSGSELRSHDTVTALPASLATALTFAGAAGATRSFTVIGVAVPVWSPSRSNCSEPLDVAPISYGPFTGSGPMALENDLASVPPQLGVLPPPPQTLTVVGATPSVVPLYLMVMAMVLMVPPGFMWNSPAIVGEAVEAMTP